MYQQSYNESILLDHDCKRMLRRVSRQLIIREVEEKLLDNSNKNNSSDEDNSSDENNNDKNNNNLNLYKFVLNFLGCN